MSLIEFIRATAREGKNEAFDNYAFEALNLNGVTDVSHLEDVLVGDLAWPAEGGNAGMKGFVR
eukprot:4615951-Karenia_brevis.AAC.1